MPISDNVVRQLTIQADSTGVDTTTQKLQGLTGAQQQVSAAAAAMTAATLKVDATLQGYQRTLENQLRAQQQLATQSGTLKAANDNVGASYSTMTGNARDFTGSIAQSTENVLNTINHLKLLALAAYAMSPAFRSMANAGASKALSEIPPIAASAAQSFLSFASPALSFFGRIGAPIAVAVAAWEGLNYTINLGSGLLEKYGNAERSLFKSDVGDNLKALTTFQNDTISLQQVQLATELGSRLTEAKKTISDFWSISIDMTGPALKLQSAWVGIVEVIAKGAAALSSIETKIREIGDSQLWQIYSKILSMELNVGAGRAAQIDPKADFDTSSTARALQLARRNLAAGLDGAAIDKVEPKAKFGETDDYKFKTFTGRFSQDVDALANPWAPPEPASRNAFDRASDEAMKNTAVMEANAQAVGLGAAAQERLATAARLTEAAMRSGGQDAVQKYADAIQSLSDRAGKAAQNLAEVKLQSEIGFQRSQIGLDPGDQQINSKLRSIYGDDINNAQAQFYRQQLQINQALQEMSDTGKDALKGFISDLEQGKSLSASFSSAMQRLEQQLSNKLIDQLWGSAMSGGAGGGGFIGLLSGLFSPATYVPSQAETDAAGAFSQGFHGGGIIGSDSPAFARYVHPAYFENAVRLHSGGIAGDEVPIIAQRGEGVFTAGQMAALGAGASPKVSVVVNNNHSTAGVDVTQKQHPDGRIDIVATIKDVVNQHAANGGFDAVNRARYGVGLRPRPR